MQELLNTGVSFTLEYNEKENAMLGQIKGYSAAVRENIETRSYGCLLWAKSGISGGESLEAYLDEQKRTRAELVKNFRVTSSGMAIALNRTDDPYTNITALKRFLYDLAGFLSKNAYVNCCCECGAESGLGIYSTGKGIAQVCSSCGEKYSLIMKVDSPAPKTVAAPAQTETLSLDNYVQELRQHSEQAEPQQVAEKPMNDDISMLLSEIKHEQPTDEPVEEEMFLKEKTEEDTAALSELMFDENDVQEEEEKPAESKNISIDSLLFTEFTEQKPIEDKPREYDCTPLSERLDNEMGALLAGNVQEKRPEPPKSKIFEEAEREFAEEQVELHKNEPEKFDINDLLLNESGEIELKEIEPVVDDGTVVTEVHDDSNYGEDIDVEELVSQVNAPTATTGHPQLSAEETPLEKDGSVPLVNPTANREERMVSPANGPDAVTPLESKFAQPITAENAQTGEKTFAPGFADSTNMIDRDAPVNFGASAAPYDPSSNYSSYVRANGAAFKSNSNAATGIIGALVGGMLGAAVWIALGTWLNIISGWFGIILTAAVFGGYHLLGREMDKKGIIISAVATIIFMIISVLGMAVADVQQVFAEYDVEMSIADALEMVGYLSELSPDVKSELIENFIFSSLITLISVISTSVKLWKTAD